MGRLFGTDGVRGVANEDVTAELALDLAVAAAHVLADAGAFAGHRPTAVVGRDPRASGEFLEAAIVSGLASAGVDVVAIGVAPTPAVAYLTDVANADLGVMLSASHNPMPDNGIKFFSAGGHKLPDDLEDLVEARMREPWARPTGRSVGRVRHEPWLVDRYVAHLVDSVPHGLAGLHIVVDGANGAASATSPEALRRAGAAVTTINCDPDGWNINESSGSTHLDALTEAVVGHSADFGVAHDGDADRCLAVAPDGSMIDGDQILAILALFMQKRGTLRHNTVVSTVMANLGFKLAMAAQDIGVVQTAVGDRYVLEEMRRNGYNLGGEQSGHVIMLDHATTGDGLLTALHLSSCVAATGSSLSELAAVMKRLPQVLINVSGVDKSRVDDPRITDAVAVAEARLGDNGRVLLRPSGTESLVRVMVEAVDHQVAQSVAEELVAVVGSVLR